MPIMKKLERQMEMDFMEEEHKAENRKKWKNAVISTLQLQGFVLGSAAVLTGIVGIAHSIKYIANHPEYIEAVKSYFEF